MTSKRSCISFFNLGSRTRRISGLTVGLWFLVLFLSTPLPVTSEVGLGLNTSFSFSNSNGPYFEAALQSINLGTFLVFPVGENVTLEPEIVVSYIGQSQQYFEYTEGTTTYLGSDLEISKYLGLGLGFSPMFRIGSLFDLDLLLGPRLGFNTYIDLINSGGNYVNLSVGLPLTLAYQFGRSFVLRLSYNLITIGGSSFEQSGFTERRFSIGALNQASPIFSIFLLIPNR